MPNGFLPIGETANKVVEFITTNDEGIFQMLGSVVGDFTEGIEKILQVVPIWLVVTIFVILGLWRVGWKFALFCALSFGIILGTDFWPATMVTLSLIFSSTLI